MDNNQGFWDKSAGIYDLFMGKDKKAYREAISLIRQEMDTSMKVLELAAGTGIFACGLADACGEFIATDFSEQMIRRASGKCSRANLSFAVQDATNMDYQDGAFDAVIIANALHIMPEPEKALREIRRVIKSGGKLFAPTFVRSERITERIMEKPMELFGFRTYSKWTYEGYINFIKENGWMIRDSQIIKASFPLAYIAAVKE